MDRPNLAANTVIFCLAMLLGCGGSGTFGGSGADDDDTGSQARPLDTSAVTDAPLLLPYSAGLRVQGWGGESTWSLEAGALPDGLSLGASGVLSGTPTWLSDSTVTVRATGMPFPDTVGDVTISVVAGEMPLGLGYERSTRNNMSERPTPLMEDAWVRIEGAGVTELSEHVIDAGIYAAGEDGVFEGGAGDDVRVGDADGIELAVGAWSGVSGEDGVTDAGGMRLVAGEDTGALSFTLSHPDWESRSYRIMAVPPDWCPLGEHKGGPWEPGQCE